MRDIYKMHGQHRYNRMHQYVIRKTKDGIVYDIYDPVSGQHYMPYRKSKRDGRYYILEGKTAGYVATEYYKGNIVLMIHPDYPSEWPF